LVCLSITLLNNGDSAYDFARELLEYRNGLDTLDRGSFAVVHLCSTFCLRRQLATPQNAKIQKLVKFGAFATQLQQNQQI